MGHALPSYRWSSVHPLFPTWKESWGSLGLSAQLQYLAMLLWDCMWQTYAVCPTSDLYRMVWHRDVVRDIPQENICSFPGTESYSVSI